MRDKSGRFIKGVHSHPSTEFKVGQKINHSKPEGWFNSTSFKKGHIPSKNIKYKKGSSNPNWKGTDVQYGALHAWVKRKLGQPKYCEHCKSTSKDFYDWANKSGQYLRDLSDWIRLCKSCHKIYDNHRIHIERLAKLIIQTFKSNKPILFMGNGGSLSMASHFSGELVAMFRKKRKALFAIALDNPVIITAIANDMGFEYIFSRQVEAYGQKAGMAICLTTSDSWVGEKHSKNLIMAVKKARLLGMRTVVIGGPRTKNLIRRVNLTVRAYGKDTPSVQEDQLTIIHKVCEKVEQAFLEKSDKIPITSA